MVDLLKIVGRGGDSCRREDGDVLEEDDDDDDDDCENCSAVGGVVLTYHPY